MSTPILQLDQICCSYDGKNIVDNFSMKLEPGQIVSILGPSGCGKSTILRAIAGFEPLDRGEIYIAGERVSAHGVFVQPEKRKVGMVFQDYALFPHLTVQKNIEFGLSRLKKARRLEVVHHLLNLIELQGLEHRYPHQLSGGQQQRVALARALAPEPKIVLLDECFSNLDADLRLEMAASVKQLLETSGASAVFVTHDVQEATFLSDQLITL